MGDEDSPAHGGRGLRRLQNLLGAEEPTQNPPALIVGYGALPSL